MRTLFRLQSTIRITEYLAVNQRLLPREKDTGKAQVGEVKSWP